MVRAEGKAGLSLKERSQDRPEFIYSQIPIKIPARACRAFNAVAWHSAKSSNEHGTIT